MSTRRDGKGTGKNRVWKELKGVPEALSQVNLNAAGIDVGASSHFVAVPEDRWEQPVREFEAFTQTCTAWPIGCWSAG